jgi:Na+/proline symporter
VLISPLAGVLITLSALLLGLGGSMIEGFPLHSQYGIFFMADKFGGTAVLALTCLVALSGCMATLSGILGTAAVIIAKDFGEFIKGSDNTLINARVCSIIIGLISLWVATIDLPNLVVIANIMYNCIGQAIVPLLLGQYWRRSNLHGAAAGMLTGIGFTLYATLFPDTIAWANGFTAGIIGLGINLTIHITLGFVFGKQAHVDEIFDTLKK